MTKNNFIYLVSVVFLIVGIMHGLRVLNGWEVQIANFAIPVWASYLGVIVAFFLAFQGFRLAKKP